MMEYSIDPKSQKVVVSEKEPTGKPPVRLQRLVSGHCYDGGCWLRILGRGISIVNKRKHPPLFSERYGYRRVIYLGHWGVELLKPANDQALRPGQTETKP